MKALFEHNGFTRMEDIPQPTQLFDILISASPTFTKGFPPPMSVSFKKWRFRLETVQVVDNEPVAIYKFEGEIR